MPPRTSRRGRASWRGHLVQLPGVIGGDILPTYPSRALAAGATINPSLRTMTAGWNNPDNFHACTSAAGRQVGPDFAAAYLGKQLAVWTGADDAQIAAVAAAYNLSSCVPAEGAGPGAPTCCGLADTVLIDAAMRCPAHRVLTALERHRPGTAYLYHLDCCPTCPPPGALGLALLFAVVHGATRATGGAPVAMSRPVGPGWSRQRCACQAVVFGPFQGHPRA